MAKQDGKIWTDEALLKVSKDDEGYKKLDSKLKQRRSQLLKEKEKAAKKNTKAKRTQQGGPKKYKPVYLQGQATIGDLAGVGKASVAKLEKAGIKSVKALQDKGPEADRLVVLTQAGVSLAMARKALVDLKGRETTELERRRSAKAAGSKPKAADKPALGTFATAIKDAQKKGLIPEDLPQGKAPEPKKTSAKPAAVTPKKAPARTAGATQTTSGARSRPSHKEDSVKYQRRIDPNRLMLADFITPTSNLPTVPVNEGMKAVTLEDEQEPVEVKNLNQLRPFAERDFDFKGVGGNLKTIDGLKFVCAITGQEVDFDSGVIVARVEIDANGKVSRSPVVLHVSKANDTRDMIAGKLMEQAKAELLKNGVTRDRFVTVTNLRIGIGLHMMFWSTCIEEEREKRAAEKRAEQAKQAKEKAAADRRELIIDLVDRMMDPDGGAWMSEQELASHESPVDVPLLAGKFEAKALEAFNSRWPTFWTDVQAESDVRNARQPRDFLGAMYSVRGQHERKRSLPFMRFDLLAHKPDGQDWRFCVVPSDMAAEISAEFKSRTQWDLLEKRRAILDGWMLKRWIFDGEQAREQAKESFEAEAKDAGLDKAFEIE
jgi:hypothetical protein